MLTSTAQFTPKWGAQLHRNIQSVHQVSVYGGILL